ncbi:hypothetical protein [Vibrio gallicus]|uniref:hypothetical protein n=1 Tax=Vibrio gallicus TaxID=190897 RepID=UPI0021C314A5|nr:hypothetical protein [Vibrio gallicus]
MLVSKLSVTLLSAYLLVSPTHASELDLSDAYKLDNQTLSTLRGGFRLANDYVVDIGISISAAVNGENIYRSTIASLVFKNGTLTAKSRASIGSTPQQENLVNVVQVGGGNVIEEPQNISGQPGATGSSVINIIQNTLDNSVIGLNTIVDVDAQVDSLNKQIQADLRLKDALLNHSH